MLLFVYGTLKRGHGNHRLLERAPATFIAEARVLNCTLLASATGGIPYMVRRAGSTVRGELYEIDVSEIGPVDMLEGHPRCYRREEVGAETPCGRCGELVDPERTCGLCGGLGSEPRTCWAYIYQNPSEWMVDIGEEWTGRMPACPGDRPRGRQ